MSQEEIDGLEAFIVSIGKHRVYVDTAYDLFILENEDRKNVEKINDSIWSQVLHFFGIWKNEI